LRDRERISRKNTMKRSDCTKLSALLLWTVLGALAAPAHATPAAASVDRSPRPDTAPDVVHTGTGTVETGTLGGASYRIDVPNAWNHALVVFFHGYSEGVFVYRSTDPLTTQTQPLFDRGYAVIESAYSASGWALAEAYPETEQLRQYFLKRYGQPAEGKAAKNMETIVVGASMGGALVTAELELNPKPYAGGLDLCGSVGPTDLAFQRRFAWRAAFDFYFPNLLPPLVPTPADFRESNALRQRVEGALAGNPAAATALRNLMELHTDREVASAVVYFTYVIGDMQRRAHGNPFDNRNFLYTGTNPSSTTADNALEDGVRRYAADPRARDYLIRHYTPTGRLNRPMLALHTTYDPRIPGATLSFYAEQVAVAGFAQNLVQQYVRRDGHCTFTADEVGRSFDELVHWIHTGQRPIPGLLPSSPARP
jgi:hypothetical protein